MAQMTESDLYDILQALMPSGVQFVDPYLDEVPTPKGDWAQMNLLSVTPIAWNQERYVADKEGGFGSYAYDIERVYSLQIDFYGANALANASLFHQTLQKNVVIEGTEISLKTIGDIENRTFLQESKKFQRRYGFDIELFIVDTITSDSAYIDNIVVNIARYGNN